MAPGTLWRRAVRRVDRRALAYRTDPSASRMTLLAEAARTANGLYPYHGPHHAPGTRGQYGGRP